MRGHLLALLLAELQFLRYLALSTVNAECWRKGHVEVQQEELAL